MPAKLVFSTTADYDDHSRFEALCQCGVANEGTQKAGSPQKPGKEANGITKSWTQNHRCQGKIMKRQNRENRVLRSIPSQSSGIYDSVLHDFVFKVFMILFLMILP